MAPPQPFPSLTANHTSQSRQPALNPLPHVKPRKPAVMVDKHSPVLAHTVQWAGEAGPLESQGCSPAPKYVRTANHWAFVMSESAITVALTDESFRFGLDMVAWVCTLSGGLRRATRAYLGYTPMWSEKDQHAWRLQCVYVRVSNIVSVGPESLKLWGHERPAAMLVQGEQRDAVYMLQTPDPNYAEYWKWYADCQEKEHGFRIPSFLTDPLKGPIPLNLNRWACNRIRQELGIPHHPDDPANGSLLTPASIRREGKARKLAMTGNRRYTQQWLKGDDENGESDASSTTADPASDRDDENDTDEHDEVMGDPDNDAIGEPDDSTLSGQGDAGMNYL
ncbi:hypothetical protein FRC08_007322 [Ceratobasidium sp. 394]|nr:hypothetical protein FRC08_007322 [Ceratobasidium sp. 394]KAG9094087.1 hypothetical protein FS749_013152 [Ceratobasidium sp. UAMH 11750]